MQRAFTSILFSTLPLATFSCLIPLSVKAQVTPDGTTSTTVNQNGNNFTIEEGDRVGDNLFHSFNQFSVPTSGSAAFNNAGDIANIFSRVTGSSVSSIDGLISANGAANLFLINPNGIIFGENASLNLGGSFFASTADSLLFEGNTEFSASNPQAPPLLEVSIPIGLNFRDNPEDITNQGNLAVKQDFTLSGGNLDLQGQLQAGGDLTLQATDTVKIRDSVDNPFIVATNGQLLVQGNQNVDIFALNHPNSGLFSGGDLILRSANAVSGDAHYWSDGNFKIEQLNENLGNFVSLFDPIVFANGDISFDSYEGASLHILAGGSVNINSIVITGTGTADDSINPTNTSELANVTLSDGTELIINGSTQPTVDIRAGIDWTQLGGLPGNSSLGVDVPSKVFGANATSGDINIGSIGIAAPDGLVFLTNQYVPNTSLPESNIQVETILTGDPFFEFSGNSGSVIIDARNNFTVGNIINTNSEFGNAGNINLIAENEISLDNSSISSSTLGDGRGGDIGVESKSLSLINNAAIASDTAGKATGGNLTIDTEQLIVEDSTLQAISNGSGNAGTLTIASDSVLVSGDLINFDGSISPSGINVGTQAENGGDGGSLIINTGETGSLTVSNGGQISASTSGSGKGGNISIDSGSIELMGRSVNSGLSSGIFASTETTGVGGTINITTNDIAVRNSAAIGSNTVGEATGGNLTIDTEQLIVEDSTLQATSNGLGNAGTLTIASDSVLVSGDLINPDGSISPSGIIVGTQAENGGDGGSLIINTGETGSLTVTDGGQISASTSGSGKGGNISIDSSSIELIGRSVNSGLPSGIFVSTSGSGNGGNLEIASNSLLAQNSAQIGAETSGLGDGGDISINTTNNLTLQNGVRFSASSVNQGNAGNFYIDTSKLVVENSLIATATNDSGNAGTLTIASDSVLVSGDFIKSDGTIGPSVISVETLAENGGDGGSLIINTGETGSLTVTDGGQISANTSGSGKGGNISIDSSSIELIGRSVNSGLPSGIFVSTSGSGNGGNLEIASNSLLAQNSAQIGAETSGLGDGGDISINATNNLTLQNGVIFSASSVNQGDAGDFDIDTSKLIVENSLIATAANDSGNAGTLTITSDSVLVSGDFINSDGSISPSSISVQTLAENGGDGGSLIINTDETGSLTVTDGGQISANTSGSGKGGNISIDSSSIELIGNSINSGLSSGIFVSTSGSGNGGNLEIASNSLLAQNSAQIGAETSGLGDGGDISINATNNLTLQNGVIFSASSVNQGDAGDFDIDTSKLIVENSLIGSAGRGSGNAGTLIIQSDSIRLQNSFLNVNHPQGQAGNLNITTDSLSQNQGTISAETKFNTIIDGENIGANINLEISDIWRIENESIVSATAFEDADGGNININTDPNLSNTELILLAFPPTGTNGSDISANAENGDGGKIDITAAGVFGIDFRDNQTSFNDFTVTSEFGQSGQTIINRTVDDPTTGLINLPASVGDASDQISQNPCQRGVGSEFLVTGKGGLPPNVNESLNSESAQVGLIESVPSQQQTIGANDDRPNPSTTPEAIPAQGWVFNNKGEVTLTAYKTTNTEIKRSPQATSNSCSALKNK